MQHEPRQKAEKCQQKQGHCEQQAHKKALKPAGQQQQGAGLQARKAGHMREAAGQQRAGNPAPCSEQHPGHAEQRKSALSCSCDQSLFQSRGLLPHFQHHQTDGAPHQTQPLHQAGATFSGKQPAGQQHGNRRGTGNQGRRAGRHTELLPFGKKAATYEHHEDRQPYGVQHVRTRGTFPVPGHQ